MTIPSTMRAVRFDRYGGREVLEVRDVPVPQPGPGSVLVRVRAAGINPGEAIIRSGALHDRLPATFPSGEGTDFAGTVVAVGDGVEGVTAGEAVLGWSWTRSSHAQYVVVPADQVVAKPAALPWEVAGALDVAGTTAWAAVLAVDPRPGDVVAVSAASGGVGVLVVQLLARRGAVVLGIASSGGAAMLQDLGAVPVVYGAGLEDRLREAAPHGIDAFVDLYGPEYLDLAVELGVPRERIVTVVFADAVQRLGVRMGGAATIDDAEARRALATLAGLLADGRLVMPIAATYPLDRVVDAYERLETGHAGGKVVLLP